MEYECVNCEDRAPRAEVPLRCREDYDPQFSEDPRVYACERDAWLEVKAPYFNPGAETEQE